MRKILLGLTTALAFGVLAVPSVAPAASKSGVSVQSSGGATINTKVQDTRNLAVNNNQGVPNTAVTNNVQSWSGQRWANDRRHHRRHHRDFLFVPFAAYGDYAAYDYCWQTVWTAAGFERIYVCGSDDYYVY
jgi:hypothetical protein